MKRRIRTLWSLPIHGVLDDRFQDYLTAELGLRFHGADSLAAHTIAHRFVADDEEASVVLRVVASAADAHAIELTALGEGEAPVWPRLSLRGRVARALAHYESGSKFSGPRSSPLSVRPPPRRSDDTLIVARLLEASHDAAAVVARSRERPSLELFERLPRLFRQTHTVVYTSLRAAGLEEPRDYEVEDVAADVFVRFGTQFPTLADIPANPARYLRLLAREEAGNYVRKHTRIVQFRAELLTLDQKDLSPRIEGSTLDVLAVAEFHERLDVVLAVAQTLPVPSREAFAVLLLSDFDVRVAIDQLSSGGRSRHAASAVLRETLQRLRADPRLSRP